MEEIWCNVVALVVLQFAPHILTAILQGFNILTSDALNTARAARLTHWEPFLETGRWVKPQLCLV